MLVYMGEIAAQVAVLFIMIVAGFVMFKSGAVKGEYLPGFTTVLLYLITPALLIDSMLKVEFSPQTVTELITVFIIALAVHAVAVGLALLMFRKKPHSQKVVYRAAVVLSNAGFMSLPLASALCGPKGVFFVSIYVMVFNVVCWTVIYRMFNPGKFNLKKLLLNPGIIGASLGAIFFFARISPPQAVGQAISYLASMNTPLAMITIGGMIATGGIKIKKEEIPCMLQSISFRLLIVPAISLAALVLLKVDPALIFAVMIPICAPVAANTAIFAGQFNADAPLGSRLLAVSTALSIATMPFVLAVAKWLAQTVA